MYRSLTTRFCNTSHNLCSSFVTPQCYVTIVHVFYLRYLLLLTILLFISDTVLKPQIKNKKTVSRPAEKDFKATNVSTYNVNRAVMTPARRCSFYCRNL